MRFARIIQAWCVAATLLASVGCSAMDKSMFQGTWVFVAVERAPFSPPPPRFDVMEFKDGHNLRLHMTPARADLDATYTLAQGRLTFSFRPPDADAPVINRVKYRFTGAGNSVLMEAEGLGSGVEYLYLRETKLLPNTIAGTYRFADKGTTSTATLAPDGTLDIQPEKVAGYYRLWKSPVGEALTWAIFLPDEGFMALTYRMNTDGGDLLLAPVYNGKAHNEGEIRWKRVD